MKEKYDLSLDNRQVVSLLIGSLVVLGAVFIIGVVVGKKLALRDEAAQAPDILTALDAQAEEHARTQQEAALTFPDELTKKSPVIAGAAPAAQPPVVTIELPAPRPAAPAGEKPASEARDPQDAEEAPTAVAQQEPTSGKAPTDKAQAERAQTARPQADKAVAANAAPAQPARAEARPAVAEAPRRGAEPVVTRTVSATPVKAATPAVARVSAPTGTAADGAFTLQLSASQSRAEADRFAQRLRERGYAPFLVEAEVEGKGTWYRVRMGRFATRDAAARYLADFKRETRVDAFITSAH